MGLKVDFRGASQWLGCDRDGVQLAPERLRREGIIKLLNQNGCEVYDCGDLVPRKVSHEEKFRYSLHMKYAEAVTEFNEQLADATRLSAKEGHLPLTVGGDHSIAIGTVSGVAEAFNDPVGVVWVDAHTDINRHDSSPSGNIHGMPLAALMGFGDPLLTHTFSPKIKVDKHHVMVVAARDIDSGEVRLIEQESLNVLDMRTLKSIGMPTALERIERFAVECPVAHLHLSLDLDAIDPQFAPGTGTPVGGGLTPEQFVDVVEAVMRSGKVCSVDFVEFNPKLDASDCRTAKLCLSLLHQIVEKITKYNK